MRERDCNTCANHRQAVALQPPCNDCMRTHNLSYWEPIEMIEQTCSNCKYEDELDSCDKCMACTSVIKHGAVVGWTSWEPQQAVQFKEPAVSNDGSTADYYVLPEGATQLQDLIAFRNMNAQLGEIQRAVYRYGQGHHSSKERDLKKIIFYAQAELDRIKKYEAS